MSGRYKNVTATDILEGNPSQESDHARPLTSDKTLLSHYLVLERDWLYKVGMCRLLIWPTGRLVGCQEPASRPN